MILFKEDFAREHAFADTKSPNLSFIKMALVLNKMHVDNNLFMLSLYDKDLVGVDPHDLKDDSLELKQRIAYEAKRNYWYYIRELVRISASGSGGIPYVLNRSNMAQAWIYLNSINGFQVMPRQIGKTIGTMSIASWIMYLAGFNVKWGEFVKGNQLQTENVDRLKKIRDALPKWLLHQTANDTNNKEGISYDALQTEFKTFVAQSDKQAAADQARGQSLATLHFDEAVYYNNIDKSYNSATAVMDAAAEQARAAGIPSAILITSTAGNLDDPRGRWCYRTVCDALRFTEKLYDCRDKAELMNTIRANSKNNYVYMEYNHKQLGKTEEWFESVTRNKDPKIVAMDYLNKWIHGAGGSIFSKELLDKIQSGRAEPKAVTNYKSLIIRWYDDPKVMESYEFRNRPFVIGCDTSDNVGSDFTTMCMIDPYDLHVVCTFRCNTTNLTFVAQYIMKMLHDFPRAIFIPERNKNGAMFLDFLFAEMNRENFNPLTRIYNSYFQNYDSETDVSNLNYDDGMVRKQFGFSTTKSATSRELLYSKVLMTALELSGDRLCDSALIDEICGITIKNNRVDHQDKGHDDLLIAFLLAAYFVLFGMNHQLYGISPDEFLRNVNNNDGSLIDAEQKIMQEQMRNRIVELRARLQTCRNDIVRNAWNRELQQLISVVGETPPESDKFVSLDQAHAQAKVDARNANPIKLDSIMNFI